MNRSHCLILIFLIAYLSNKSQTFSLTGKITDGKEPLPFATIVLKGTDYLTTSNVDGNFTFRLKAGQYHMEVHYLGFKKKLVDFVLQDNKFLLVEMEPEGYKLEVDINAGEDPSYPIMRKAIKARKTFHQPVENYSCRSYIKGLQKLGSIPKKLGTMIKLMGGNPSDTGEMKGVIYNSESESRYYFMKPNYEKEIMFSSRVSGNSGGFSFNQLHDMLLLNCNEAFIRMGGVSQRPFISPLNDKAFNYYRFFLLGQSATDEGIINKIKVVPKRKTDPCFAGIIYVQDSTWRLTGVDLKVFKETKIDFLDTLSIKETYAPVQGDSIWMLVNLSLNFSFNALGFNGRGYFNAAISEYNFTEKKEKRFFGNEVFVVEAGANKKDENYWKQYRSLQLTTEETLDYAKKDSLEKIRDQPAYKDSLEKVNNRFEWSDLLTGYSFTKHRRNLSFDLPGIITNGIQYNTVEGINLTYKMNLRKTFERSKVLSTAATLHYGFANRLPGVEVDLIYRFNVIHNGFVGLSATSLVRQYNARQPVLPLVNSLSTLLLNMNPMKLFFQQGGSINTGMEVINGLTIHTEVGYYRRSALENVSKKLFFDDPTLYFTSNIPYHHSLTSSPSTSDVLLYTLAGTIKFKQRYITLPEDRVRLGSKYPALHFTFQAGIPAGQALANFQKLTLSINDVVRFGLAGRLRYRIVAGSFLFQKAKNFFDYMHFNGNQLAYYHGDYLNGFRLMPYYQFSTNSWFLEAHAEHHFNGWLFSRIPGLRQLPWQEVIGLNTLCTNETPLYLEANAGVERIFKILRCDYVFRYEPGKRPVHGVVVGMKLSF